MSTSTRLKNMLIGMANKGDFKSACNGPSYHYRFEIGDGVYGILVHVHPRKVELSSFTTPALRDVLWDDELDEVLAIVEKRPKPPRTKMTEEEKRARRRVLYAASKYLDEVEHRE